MNNILQFFIFALGLPAIILIGRKGVLQQKIGYVCGLLSQPFWIVTAYQHRQWGILVLSCMYSFAWIEGIYRLFIKPLIFSDDCLLIERMDKD